MSSNSSIADILLARGDDWSGLYRDDKLVFEGHEVRAEDLIREMGVDNIFRVVRVRVVRVDDAWLDARGCLPEKSAELKAS
jgi:hypothetical protein